MSIEKLLLPESPEKERLDVLKALFPEIFADDRINLDALKEILPEAMEDDEAAEEHYGLSWPGKRAAKKLVTLKPTGTLMPMEGEGVDEETTKNVIIEGDNLEVLRILQKSYAGRIKMIYIDPPYNTGQDFIYKDDFKEPVDSYLRRTGQADEEGLLTSNPKASGRYHSNWLSMMYPRLKLAKNLLRDDGVIFISIDDNEVANLRKLCDEIFGEENFLGTICWKKKTNGNNMGEIPPVHDYVIAFSKQFSDNLLLGKKLDQDYISKNYTNPDNDPRGPWTTSDLSANHEGPYFSITNSNTNTVYYPPQGRYWVFNEAEVRKRIEDGRIIFGKTGNAGPVQKKYLSERTSLRCKADSWWDSHGLNEDGTSEINELIAAKAFTHPKPSLLIKNLCDICLEDGVVLDFFSGSGTTAHAIMDLNAQDGGNRKFIMVQLPEPCDEKSEAYKAGFKTIADIGKERIRRAAAKIKAKNPEFTGDTGFQVYRLATSNRTQWKPLENPSLNLLEGILASSKQTLVDGWKTDEVIIEMMLLEGFPLDVSKTKLSTIASNEIWKITHPDIGHSLLVCLDAAIEESTTAYLQQQPKEDIFICLDSALNDQAKLALSDALKVKTL